jgi:hypothetical protein
MGAQDADPIMVWSGISDCKHAIYYIAHTDVACE